MLGRTRPHFVSTAPDIAYAYVADYRRLRPDVTHEADSLESVCRVVRLDTKTVTEAVDGSELESGPWVLLGPVSQRPKAERA